MKTRLVTNEAITRREFVISAGLGLTGLSVLNDRALRSVAEAAEAPVMGGRPNVLFIYTDDMDLFELGCTGGKVLTPHMDGIARDGVTFTRGYVVSPVCTPSRYNVVTGGYASRARNLAASTPAGSWPILTWNPQVTSETTVPQMLRAAGYRTGMVGKWHLSGMLGTSLPEDARADDPAVVKIMTENYARVQSDVRKAGFDYADALYALNPVGSALPKAWQVHNQDWVTARALDFLNQGDGRPFYLYMAGTVPHGPAGLPSMESDPRFTPAGLLPEAPRVQPSRQDVLRRTRAAGIDDKLAFLTWLDDGVGAVLRRIEELGLADNTLVMLVSDNGNPGKLSCYEGGAHVPFIARWPGRIRPGTTSDALVCNLDAPATALDVAGATIPREATVDGRSLAPLFAGASGGWRDHLMLEITYSRAVVSDGWKYIAVRFPPEVEKRNAGVKDRINHEGKPGAGHYDMDEKHPGYYDRDQLYDLRADPNEQVNLAADPTHKAKLDEMKALLKKDSARLPMPFGEFKP
jgi:arylsulfatase A-like enzyme